MKSLFSRLDYPHYLTNSAINTFIYSRVADQQPLQASGRLAGNDVTRAVIPFKDQDSADIAKTQLKDLSIKLQPPILPVSVSRKIVQDLKECKTKPQLINQQCVVYQFKCNLCDIGSYVGYTRGHLYGRVDGHKSTSSSVRKHYILNNDHAGTVPEDLLSCLKVFKKCMNKFDCLVNEMLYIKQLTPSLNVQTDSIRAKVFVYPLPLCKSVQTLELAFVNFILICTLDNGVMKSPKRREIISHLFLKNCKKEF